MHPSHYAHSYNTPFSLCTLLITPTRTTPPSRYAPFSLRPLVQHPLLAMHPSHYAHSYNTPFSLCTLLITPTRTTPPSRYAPFSPCPLVQHPLLAMHPSHYAHSYNTPFSICTLLITPTRTTPPSHRTFFILLHPLLVTPRLQRFLVPTLGVSHYTYLYIAPTHHPHIHLIAAHPDAGVILVVTV